ncbi:uncharacterized protein LOC116825343 isoform X1 [Chelonoidis abingdonii]|uniref:uncharacterized protein LOC116825343 isoform X1 n=1 Tax=Chelonoidis abingdonii TaxID=106734 RepID=UPI0013F25155|nr:uncharacterized protein LOC116825343 isoform X1 [Chelonoidis abingdonii]
MAEMGSSAQERVKSGLCRVSFLDQIALATGSFSAHPVCSLLPNTLPLPQTFHSSLEMQGPPPSSRKLVILTVGAVAVLTVSIVGVLVATYLGRTTCIQRDAYGYLPTQVNVQNEASLLLALSELGEQGVAPGITCDLRNHLMVYHGQPEGCVAQKMEPSDQLPSCQELESYFQAVLRNATLGITSDVQSMGTGSLGSLTTLLCSNKPTYLITAFAPSPRHHISMAA